VEKNVPRGTFAQKRLLFLSALILVVLLFGLLVLHFLKVKKWQTYSWLLGSSTI
jgi:hypothetical protein